MPAHRSLWLEEAVAASDADATPPLTGTTRADVAILGGGYVGLWTALALKRRDPACDVIVLERDICGGGASGRNGGMVLSWWPKLASLIACCGVEEALRLGRASEAAIDAIEQFCAAQAPEAAFRRGGFLWTATTPDHIGAWDGVLALCEEHGIAAFERLEPAQVARRSGSARHLAGVFDPRAATVQPAQLARALRRAALQAGVRIHEQTEALRFSRARPLVIDVPGGSVEADKLVLATNAWAAREPELGRALVIVSSDIVATPPIPDRLAQIGWTGGEGITDSYSMVAYYRTTSDGRVAFGKGTAGVGYGGRVGTRFDNDPRHAAMTLADFRRYYPALADVPVQRSWGGPIDRTPESLPLLGHLGGREHLLYGVGWSGNGVGPSYVGGDVLAGLVLDDPAARRCGLVDRAGASFPPEPLRYAGAQIVRAAVIRKEQAQAAGRRPKPLAVRVAALAPAGLEDKG